MFAAISLVHSKMRQLLRHLSIPQPWQQQKHPEMACMNRSSSASLIQYQQQPKAPFSEAKKQESGCKRHQVTSIELASILKPWQQQKQQSEHPKIAGMNRSSSASEIQYQQQPNTLFSEAKKRASGCKPQFRYALHLRYCRTPPNLPTHCDGCGAQFSIAHGHECKKGGFVIFSETSNFMKSRMSTAIVRATHLCIRGSRIPTTS